VPLRPVPLAILSRRHAQGEGKESGRATRTGDIIDRLAVATVDAAGTGTTGRAHEPLRVAGDEGTRAPALTCPITGMKGNHEHFLRMNSIYYLYTDLLPVHARLFDPSFRCSLNRELSQPKK